MSEEDFRRILVCLVFVLHWSTTYFTIHPELRECFTYSSNRRRSIRVVDQQASIHSRTEVREEETWSLLETVTVDLTISWQRSRLVGKYRLVDGYFSSFTLRCTRFGSNQDYTISTLVTIKYSCRKTFQYRHALDVVWIDIQETRRSGSTTACKSVLRVSRSVKRNTIHNEQRLVVTSR